HPVARSGHFHRGVHGGRLRRDREGDGAARRRDRGADQHERHEQRERGPHGYPLWRRANSPPSPPHTTSGDPIPARPGRRATWVPAADGVDSGRSLAPAGSWSQWAAWSTVPRPRSLLALGPAEVRTCRANQHEVTASCRPGPFSRYRLLPAGGIVRDEEGDVYGHAALEPIEILAHGRPVPPGFRRVPVQARQPAPELTGHVWSSRRAGQPTPRA